MKRFSLNPEALRTPAGAASAAFTFAALIALLWGVWRFIDWGVINAVFQPDYEACHASDGACWGFVAEKWRMIIFGRFPYEEQWRPAVGTAVIVLMLVLAVHSFTLPGAGEGLSFYLIPHFSKITGSVVVGAMNQAFFTLSVGMGGMAIFGSYIGKDRSLMGESIHIIILDTLVAVIAGIIIFPACFTYDVEVTAGPSLLFDTMATVFNHMAGGRFWGTLFFVFMTFAAASTVTAVFQNIVSFIFYIIS